MKVSTARRAQETLDEHEATTTSFAGTSGEETERCGCDAECGQDLAAVLQALEVSDLAPSTESTLDRWRKQYVGMKSEEEKRLKTLEDENKRLVADLSLDNQMLKHIAEGNF